MCAVMGCNAATIGISLDASTRFAFIRGASVASVIQVAWWQRGDRAVYSAMRRGIVRHWYKTSFEL